jgi:hypothetical protein
MNLSSMGLVAAGALALMAGCASRQTPEPPATPSLGIRPAPPPPREPVEKPRPALPPVSSHLEPEWLDKAESIQTSVYSIYYHGTAKGQYVAGDRAWFGSVTGDILVLSTAAAIIIPSGTLTIGPGDIKIDGPHRMISKTGSQSAWAHLLKK